jgi:hypothetical protein
MLLLPQEDWRKDPKKCTFIVLAKSGGGSEMERMAGDVNLFFSDPDDPKAAEIEVMIAEPRYRRQGYAREAVSMMMKYGVQQLGVTRFYCKVGPDPAECNKALVLTLLQCDNLQILEDNLASRSLFESLSYFSCNYVAAFREVEYQRIIADESVVNMIVKAAASMEVAPYDSDIGDEGIEQEMGKDA